MLPINPRELQKQLKQLKRMGLKMEQLEAEEVSIISRDRVMLLKNPQVLVLEFGNQKVYYIIPESVEERVLSGEAEFAPSTVTTPSAAGVSISSDDIEFVASYLGISKEKAAELLKRAGGDIAKAIELGQSGTT